MKALQGPYSLDFSWSMAKRMFSNKAIYKLTMTHIITLYASGSRKTPRSPILLPPSSCHTILRPFHDRRRLATKRRREGFQDFNRVRRRPALFQRLHWKHDASPEADLTLKRAKQRGAPALEKTFDRSRQL